MEPPGISREPASPWAFAGMIGFACAFFLYAVTPTFMDPPWWVLVLMFAGWLVALVQAGRWFVRRPLGVLALAALVTLAWFPLVVLGGRVLGWA